LGATFPQVVSASNVLGSTTGVAPAAGVIGERLSATVGAVAMTVSGTVYNAASLVLTAGAWQVFGKVVFGTGGSTVAACVASISTTSATENTKSYVNLITTNTADIKAVHPMPITVNTAGQTVYLTGRMSFTGTGPSTDASYTDFYAIRIG
jgi:hypothetical protein